MTNAEKLDALKRARSLISDESKWCQKAFAINCHGIKVPPNSSGAVRWCAYGAACAVRGVDFDDDEVLDMFGGCVDIYATNDFAGHAAVLSKYDELIAELEVV